MTVRQIQGLLACVFFVLGGWCLISPTSVLALAITAPYRSDAPIVAFLLGCFGAQAMIAGLFAAAAQFTRHTFLAYGLGLLPFFVFDYWFYVVTPILTPLGMLDALGNVIMLGLCILGWRAAEADRP